MRSITEVNAWTEQSSTRNLGTEDVPETNQMEYHFRNLSIIYGCSPIQFRQASHRKVYLKTHFSHNVKEADLFRIQRIYCADRAILIKA
jgi:hypothetical protein